MQDALQAMIAGRNGMSFMVCYNPDEVLEQPRHRQYKYYDTPSVQKPISTREKQLLRKRNRERELWLKANAL